LARLKLDLARRRLKIVAKKKSPPAAAHLAFIPHDNIGASAVKKSKTLWKK
jgi:hypothetical protein